MLLLLLLKLCSFSMSEFKTLLALTFEHLLVLHLLVAMKKSLFSIEYRNSYPKSTEDKKMNDRKIRMNDEHFCHRNWYHHGMNHENQ